MKITKMMKKFVSGVLVGMAALVGFTPLTVFAQGKEAECICEEKCTEDRINEDCEVCIYDYHAVLSSGNRTVSLKHLERK